MITQNVTMFTYTKVIDLNIFPRRSFGSHLDEHAAKRYGQWSTRLYIVLLVAGVSIFALHTMIRPRTDTKTFDRLSLATYRDLLRKYGDQLQCPCTSISSPHNRFLEIEPVFHQVRTYYSNRCLCSTSA
jgi:hypothetical protein